MSAELLPCPFCGGNGRHVVNRNRHHNDGEHDIECDGCEASVRKLSTPTEAAEAWNTRTPASGAVEAAAERLRRMTAGECDVSVYDGPSKDRLEAFDADIRIVLAALASSPQLSGNTGELTSEPKAEGRAWRCFQCDDVFNTEADAALHFGKFDDCVPACKIGAERFRAMEAELHGYRTESDAASKTFYSLGADHQTALRKAEQEGYDKGLADGRVQQPAPQPLQGGEVTREAVAEIISGAPFPSKRTFAKADRILALISPAQREGER